MGINGTHLRYLREIAKHTGPVAAQALFNEMHVGRVALYYMVEAGVIEKQMVDGKSHYRLTQNGIDAIRSNP